MNKYQLSTDHMPEASQALNYISEARWQKPLPDGAHTILSFLFLLLVKAKAPVNYFTSFHSQKKTTV